MYGSSIAARTGAAAAERPAQGERGDQPEPDRADRAADRVDDASSTASTRTRRPAALAGSCPACSCPTRPTRRMLSSRARWKASEIAHSDRQHDDRQHDQHGRREQQPADPRLLPAQPGGRRRRRGAARCGGPPRRRWSRASWCPSGGPRPPSGALCAAARRVVLAVDQRRASAFGTGSGPCMRADQRALALRQAPAVERLGRLLQRVEHVRGVEVGQRGLGVDAGLELLPRVQVATCRRAWCPAGSAPCPPARCRATACRRRTSCTR